MYANISDHHHRISLLLHYANRCASNKNQHQMRATRNVSPICGGIGHPHHITNNSITLHLFSLCTILGTPNTNWLTTLLTNTMCVICTHPGTDRATPSSAVDVARAANQYVSIYSSKTMQHGVDLSKQCSD